MFIINKFISLVCFATEQPIITSRTRAVCILVVCYFVIIIQRLSERTKIEDVKMNIQT